MRGEKAKIYFKINLRKRKRSLPLQPGSEGTGGRLKKGQIEKQEEDGEREK